jgi:hypothetical protein
MESSSAIRTTTEIIWHTLWVVAWLETVLQDSTVAYLKSNSSSALITIRVEIISWPMAALTGTLISSMAGKRANWMKLFRAVNHTHTKMNMNTIPLADALLMRGIIAFSQIIGTPQILCAIAT